MKKAVILFSGGLDSTIILASALQEGIECFPLTFDYSQRHRIELTHAKELCLYYGVEQRVIILSPTTFANTSLVNDLTVPKGRDSDSMIREGIPNTYVPARNTLFLAYAISYAEAIGASEIHFGANALDQSGYPDCRPKYMEAVQQLINVATKQGVEGDAPQLKTPLLYKTKKEIVKMSMELKVPVELTFSCYDPTSEGKACGECDACTLRIEGFGGTRA